MMIDAIPHEVNICEAQTILKRKGNQIRFSPTNGKYYPLGVISESSGMLYVDVSSSQGSFTFVFTGIVPMFNFLLHHTAADNFANLK